MPRERRVLDDPRIAALFAEPPERFVTARDALARELESAGDPAARAVRALRRPPRRRWVLNRLAREHPDEVAGLLEAGARLREAHAAALAGTARAGLREADEALSVRLDALVRAAGALLAPPGHAAPAAALLGQLRMDLRALAAAGGEQAEGLRLGTVAVVPTSSGDDALAAALTNVAPPPRARAGGGRAGGRGAREEVRTGPAPAQARTAAAGERARAAAARARDRAAARELQRARQALRSARADLDRAERAAARADGAVATAEQEAAAARRQAAEAREAREAASAALARAEARARELQGGTAGG